MLKQYFEGYEGGPGELKVLDTELFSTEEGRSAIVTFDNPRGTSWSHAYITNYFTIQVWKLFHYCIWCWFQLASYSEWPGYE